MNNKCWYLTRALQLFSRKKKGDLQKCINCLNFKDSKEITKLTSTEAGRNSIIEASKTLEDDLLHGLSKYPISSKCVKYRL